MNQLTLGVMNQVFTNVQQAALFIGSLTVIGGGVLWVYQQTIGKAKEIREETRAKQLRDLIEANNKPLLETLTKLDLSLQDTVRHRHKMDVTTGAIKDVLEKQDHTLDEHDERLVVLEVTNGIRKVRYLGTDLEEGKIDG